MSTVAVAVSAIVELSMRVAVGAQPLTTASPVPGPDTSITVVWKAGTVQAGAEGLPEE